MTAASAKAIDCGREITLPHGGQWLPFPGGPGYEYYVGANGRDTRWRRCARGRLADGRWPVSNGDTGEQGYIW